MKTSLSTIERAENSLIHIMNNASPLSYIRELEKLCRSCGWSLQEYWRTSLAIIDAAWEEKAHDLS